MYKQLIIPALSVLLSLSYVKAQDMGKAQKMYYYEHWQPAKTEFEKTAATNPDAAYWLIETLLQLGQTDEAKKTATRSIEKFTNNPLLLVALGHTTLYTGNTVEAKAYFDRALTIAVDANKASVLKAIGRAHANVPLKYSMPDYAIGKLKEALALEPSSASIYICIGDCYRKKMDGGAAMEAYLKAFAMDKSLTAEANYKIGRIFAVQQNCQVFTEYFTKATDADANYMPAWRELYENYADKEGGCINFEKSKIYFDQYMKTSPQGDETELLKASFAYSTKNYATAISTAKQLIQKMGSLAPARLYKLIGYAYYEQNDFNSAISWVEDYFTKETNTENIITHNYRVLAMSYDTTGNLAKAKETWLKAANFEPEENKKWFFYEAAATVANKMNNKTEKATILQMIVDKKAKPTSTDYFKCGTAWYLAGNYTKAIPVLSTYAEKYPTDWRPSIWLARSYAQIDTTMEAGTAVAHYEKALSLFPNDKSTLTLQVEANMYLFAYSYNIKKNKNAAIEYLDKALLIDPNNANAKKYKEMLSN